MVSDELHLNRTCLLGIFTMYTTEGVILTQYWDRQKKDLFRFDKKIDSCEKKMIQRTPQGCNQLSSQYLGTDKI